MLVGVTAAVAYASHIGGGPQGHTTLQEILVGNGASPYEDLQMSDIPDQTHIVRDKAYETANPHAGVNPDAIPSAGPGRAASRDSLAYFAQMTDFQLADEESPARVEFVDPGASSAWRPQEALIPFQVEETVQQINAFAGESPVDQGSGMGNVMDFALITGDQADNMQKNESIWVRDLLEGGPPELPNFNSGDVADLNPALPGCAAASVNPGVPALTLEAPKYTGVQDYTDYPLGAPNQSLYYDPNTPTGQYAGWPDLHQPDGPRPADPAHPDRSGQAGWRGWRPPLLRHQRQSRHPCPGQRGRQPRVRADRDRLPQGTGQQRPARGPAVHEPRS